MADDRLTLPHVGRLSHDFWEWTFKKYHILKKIDWKHAFRDFSRITRKKIFTIDWRHAFRDFTRFVRRGFKKLPTSSCQGLREDIQEAEIIFVIGCDSGESKRYRVFNMAEGLREMGYSVGILPGYRFMETINFRCVQTVVLFRFAWDPNLRMEETLRGLRTRGILVIADFDDLVFFPEIVEQIDGYRYLSAEEKKCYRADIERYRRLLLNVDRAVCSTSFLARKIKELGIPPVIVPNTLCRQQITIADSELAQLRRDKKEHNEWFTILYASGSCTHEKDFEECATALVEFLRAHKKVRFVLIGHLNLPKSFDDIIDRVIHKSFMPYEELMLEIASCHVNIAPLEQHNPFNDSKSELKIFEAGLMGVPTIASPTDSYSCCIKHGKNGMLAHDKKEWLSALDDLYSSPSLRRGMGEEARITALTHFRYDMVARRASLQAYNLRPFYHLEEKLDIKHLHIAWIIPGISKNSGGHRNILRTAYYLAQQGHEIVLYFILSEKDHMSDGALQEFIHSNFYPIKAKMTTYKGTIAPQDIIFATHWTTVAAALSNRSYTREIFYFVQDFEPYFAPMGSEYILAENTYKKGLYHITSGPWCERFLKLDYQAEADSFLFPIDRDTYHPTVRLKKNKNIIFFAKPEMPRRCYELGVLVLLEFNRLCPDIEIIFFGSNKIDKSRLDFPVTVYGIMPSIADLAQLYNNADLGVVFSTTNPSLVPYEMMACGLPVVDIDHGDNHYNYGMRRDIALLCEPEPEVMARQMVCLLNDPQEREMRRKKGIEFAATFPTEDEMGSRVERLIQNRMLAHLKKQKNCKQ